MPKKGYASVTLREEVVRLLREESKRKGIGLNELILKLIEDRPRTVLGDVGKKSALRIRRPYGFPPTVNPQESDSGSFLWCGGRDSNPRRPTPRDPQSRAFDLTRPPPLHIGETPHDLKDFPI